MWNVQGLNPIAFEIFGINVYWYGLAYALSILLVFYITPKLVAKYENPIPPKVIDDYFFFGVLSMIIGGRLGYVLIYQPSYYLQHPLDIFKTTDGGMSFHGALLVIFIWGYIYTRIRKVPALSFADAFGTTIPIGLFFGRIANFVNGELYGRPTDGTWGVIFADGIPRHPSQLYEAGLEGIVLFSVLIFMVTKYRSYTYRGLTFGVFLIGYGISRIIVEGFREPDSYVGYLSHNTTMGQWLSVPMVIIGSALVHRAVRGRI